MRRRDAIKGIGALAGAAYGTRLLAGCGEDHAGPPPPPTIVVVMMENRSYDHVLGARSLLEGKPGDGLVAGMSNPDGEGGAIEIFPASDLCTADPPHGWESSRAQWNLGANDGFVTAHIAQHGAGAEPVVMSYLTRADQPFTWALADAYASCDRWFSSVLGPTWPNRMYLHSAQSGGLTENVLPQQGGIPWPSLWHRLEEAGIDWAYYYNDLPFVPLFTGLPVQGRIRRMSPDFFDDAAAGRLPPVVFVDPAFGLNDDHPPHHTMLGQQLLAALYAGLAASPQWDDCLFVVTYDEHGGFFDHVPPPTVVDERAADGFDRLGFRVPTLVAGPYVKSGHVSSVVRDHTSVIAHVLRTYDLPPLTARDAAAEDLSELLDPDRLARRDPRPPAPMPAIEIDAASLPADCLESELRPIGELEELADAGFFAAGLDRRRDRRDLVREIGDALARLEASAIGAAHRRRR